MQQHGVLDIFVPRAGLWCLFSSVPFTLPYSFHTRLATLLKRSTLADMFWSEKPTLIRGPETLGRQASQWPWLTTGEDSKTCEEANEVRSLKCHFCFKAKQNKALQVLSFVQYSKIRTLLNYTREKRFKKKKGLHQAREFSTRAHCFYLRLQNCLQYSILQWVRRELLFEPTLSASARFETNM